MKGSILEYVGERFLVFGGLFRKDGSCRYWIGTTTSGTRGHWRMKGSILAYIEAQLDNRTG